MRYRFASDTMRKMKKNSVYYAAACEAMRFFAKNRFTAFTKALSDEHFYTDRHTFNGYNFFAIKHNGEITLFDAAGLP